MDAADVDAADVLEVAVVVAGDLRVASVADDSVWLVSSAFFTRCVLLAFVMWV